MRTSAAGLEFIAKWEGERLKVYHDVAGVATIGIGHALRPGESFPDGITHEQAIGLLTQDVAIAEHAVNTAVTASIGQNAFDALVSFTFNCGGGALRSSAILSYLNGGYFHEAGGAFLQWDKRKDPATGGLVEDSGLLARRSAERNLFLTPDAPSAAPTLPDVAALAHAASQGAQVELDEVGEPEPPPEPEDV